MQALGQYGAGQQLQGGANQVMNTAFDPQQALYNQLYAKTMAQQNANNAMAGVGMTPYGAGLADQNTQNFNIAWQAQQLQNQIAGLNSATGATQAGQGLSAAAPGQYLNASQTPYNVYGQIGAGQIGALNTLGQFGQAASTIPQQQIQDYQAYLGGGAQQQSVNNQSAALQAQLNNMYQNQFGAGLSGLGNAYSAFGGQPIFGGGGGYYGGGNVYSSPGFTGGYQSDAAIY